MPRLTPDATSSHAYSVHGDVEIDGEVAIAPGVILIAEPGSRLVIASGVCLGTDVIVRARRGDLVIEPDANLGSGVLIVGRGRVGAQACVGAGSTLIDPHLAPRAVVASRSIEGDPSQPAKAPESDAGHAPTEPAGEAATEASLPESNGHSQNGHSQNGHSQNGQNGHTHENGNGANGHSGQNGGNGGSHVYGRDQVQQLLNTLFPHRHTLGTAPPPRSE